MTEYDLYCKAMDLIEEAYRLNKIDYCRAPGTKEWMKEYEEFLKGISVMVSTSDFDSGREGSSPSSSAKKKTDRKHTWCDSCHRGLLRLGNNVDKTLLICEYCYRVKERYQ